MLRRDARRCPAEYARVSYFWSVFGRPQGHERLPGPARRLVPEDAGATVLRASSDADPPSQVEAHSADKPIPDLLVEDGAGSWLLLAGTPLVEGGAGRQLLPDFLRDPAAFLRERVEGQFAVLAHDAAGRRFFAASDFNCTVPVFYAEAPGGVMVASHELALAAARGAALDPFGVAQFIALGFPWGAETRFEGVRKLTPCQLLTAGPDGAPTVTDYWRPQDETARHEDLDTQVAWWSELLRESVARYHASSSASEAMSDFTAGEDARMVVAACHAAGIPLTLHTGGENDATNVAVAETVARELGLELIRRLPHRPTPEQVERHAIDVVADSDGYKNLFQSFRHLATDTAHPLDPSMPRFAGIPGGEAFRGSYYLRGKAVRPDSTGPLDVRAFTRLKYLLDRAPGLVRFDDEELVRSVHAKAERAVQDVLGFGVGTQIDHLLRLFQTGAVGLKYRYPLYLPLAGSAMTRSIYQLRPRLKQGGRVTRAATEQMWPELARIRTQNGIPTIRRTARTQHLFLPEYVATARKIVRGFNTRILKVRTPNKIGYSIDLNAEVLDTLLGRPPFADWLAGADSMLTGHVYEPAALEALLSGVRAGHGKGLPHAGRVISLELAARWCAEQ